MKRENAMPRRKQCIVVVYCTHYSQYGRERLIIHNDDNIGGDVVDEDDDDVDDDDDACYIRLVINIVIRSDDCVD